VELQAIEQNVTRFPLLFDSQKHTHSAASGQLQLRHGLWGRNCASARTGKSHTFRTGRGPGLKGCVRQVNNMQFYADIG
jgi:hypothetical protein